MKYIKRKKGYSLLELLLVLGIVASLVVSAFIIYPKIKYAEYVSRESKNIGVILSSVYSLYNGKPTYTGLSTTQLVRPALIFPDDMIVESDSISWGRSKWSGYVTVDSNNVSPTGRADSSFTIAYSDVPSEVCTKLISAVQGHFYNIYVSNTIGIGSKNIGTLVKNKGEALDMDLTAKTCQNFERNQVVFLAL